MEIYSLTKERIGQVDIFNNFKEALQKEKLKKFEQRKDVNILLDLKQKYDIISNKHSELKRLEKAKAKNNSKKGAYYRLKNGSNFFELKEKDAKKLNDIYELYFKDSCELNLSLISYLPNLKKLECTFSELAFPHEINQEYYFNSLNYLDLSFNNLDSSIFVYLKQITALKNLFLAGNKITPDIPDITALCNLEELDLSYNEISSSFLNLDYTNEDLIEIFNKLHTNTKREFEFNSSNSYSNSLSEEKKVSSSTSESDFNLKIQKNSKSGYEEINKILQTNVHEFFHILSNLKKLKTLNLSHNKIHYFDVDPIRLHEENGFNCLKNLNISHNLITEEISIILVVNIPNLKCIDISHNPIVLNKIAYENIEYEIFKNRNVYLINSKRKEKEFTFFKNKFNRDKHEKDEEKLTYKVKNIDIFDLNKFSENVKLHVDKKSKYYSDVQKEIENGGDENEIKNKGFVDDAFGYKYLLKKESDLFITKADEIAQIKKHKKKKQEISLNTCESYDKFLNLANLFFGKEKHYKKSLPILKAYQKLKHVVNNLQNNSNDDLANYMKPRIYKINHNTND